MTHAHTPKPGPQGPGPPKPGPPTYRSSPARYGSAGSAACVAAEHGVVGLTKTAALEYASQGVRINAVGPGYLDTPLLAGIGQEASRSVRPSSTAAITPTRGLRRPLSSGPAGE